LSLVLHGQAGVHEPDEGHELDVCDHIGVVPVLHFDRPEP